MSTFSGHISYAALSLYYCENCLEQFGLITILSSHHRHLRLELLEGVVAYHCGQFEKSRKVLTSAQEKFTQVCWIMLCML